MFRQDSLVINGVQHHPGTLLCTGIAIPGKALDHQDSGGEKKKVRYGSRQRPKKPRQEQTANVEDGELLLSPTTPTIMMFGILWYGMLKPSLCWQCNDDS